MKTFILATIITVVIGSSVFAADATKINFRVLNAFENKFSGATNVNWSTTEVYTKAEFELEDEKIEVFFNSDAQMIGVFRKANIRQLPLSAIQKIKKNYAQYQITETLQFELNGERRYYVSVENGPDKKILEVSLYGEVTVFDKNK